MKNLKLKECLKDLSGTDIAQDGKPLTVGIAVATILSFAKGKDPLKLRVLAEKFYDADVYDLDADAADTELIKDVIKTSEHYIPLVLGDLLLRINNAKDDSTEPGQG